MFFKFIETIVKQRMPRLNRISAIASFKTLLLRHSSPYIYVVLTIEFLNWYNILLFAEKKPVYINVYDIANLYVACRSL